MSLETHSVMGPDELLALGCTVPEKLAAGRYGPPVRARLEFTAPMAVVDGACAWIARHGATERTRRIRRMGGGTDDD